jgi:hypothetical protein
MKIEISDDAYVALRDMLDPDCKTIDDVIVGLLTLADVQAGQLTEMRESLRMAESYAKGFENVRLDLVNERNELGRRLALADAVINRIEADGGNSYQVRELVKAYRAAEVKP